MLTAPAVFLHAKITWVPAFVFSIAWLTSISMADYPVDTTIELSATELMVDDQRVPLGAIVSLTDTGTGLWATTRARTLYLPGPKSIRSAVTRAHARAARVGRPPEALVRLIEG